MPALANDYLYTFVSQAWKEFHLTVIENVAFDSFGK